MTSSVSAAEIHAIIVGNTANDVGLYAAQKSIDQINREVKRIAAYNELPLNIAVFEGFDVRINPLLNYLEQLKVSNDDIVFFFIVTHGTRDAAKTNSLPNLIFPFEESPVKNQIDFQEINKILKRKNAKLLISIAEACNTFELPESSGIGFANVPNEKSKIPIRIQQDATEFQFIRQGNPRLQQVYRNLFGGVSGTIVISSASPGESSLGGLFIHQLLQSISTAEADESWKKVLKDTFKQVNLEVQKYTQGQKQQRIQYELKLY